MMMVVTWNATENSSSFIFAWVARYDSFAWSVHLLFQMHKTSMLIIQRKVQKLYLCCRILERQISILHIPALCSKHLTLFRVLCRPQALSREPIFLHRYANEKHGEKSSRCCQCQDTTAEQSCEPCSWAWMIFFTSLRWLENSKEMLLGIKMCQKGKHCLAVVLIRLFYYNDSCFVLQSLGDEWILTSP